MLSAAEPEITPDQSATSARWVTPSSWTYIGKNGRPRPKPTSVKNCVAEQIHAVRSHPVSVGRRAAMSSESKVSNVLHAVLEEELALQFDERHKLQMDHAK